MKLSINLNHCSYDVIIRESIIQKVSFYLSEINNGQKFILCFPSKLLSQASSLFDDLKSNNFDINRLEIKDGEEFKNIEYIQELAGSLMQLGCKRDSILIALGGGTVGDVVGFLGSIFMRGIKYINIPTSLLAMVDSSMGGKTGVNYNKIKNFLGSFHHPELVLIDPNFLLTLDQKQVYSGLGEIIKYGLIDDKKILTNLIKNYNCIIQLKRLDIISDLIYKSCLVKKKFIEQDVYDKGYRNILNFGHTLGHIIETKFQSEKITHGEAILHGIFLSLKLSHLKKVLSKDKYNEILALLEKLNIQNKYKLNSLDIEKINFDKKSNNHSIRFVLIEDIGVPIVLDNITIQDIEEII
tara:strand:+ start:11269 stop:12330 length:1062 start_codon:yes stop_codon:yes gene_type:complete